MISLYQLLQADEIKMDQGKRPTIKDVAAEANFSLAHRQPGAERGSGAVRQGTRERVRLAAEQIGFYGMGALRSRVAAARPRYRFGFLLHPARPRLLNATWPRRCAWQRKRCPTAR